MKKANQIRQILQFYVQMNKLKTIIADEPNNFSIADNTFGSIILAIACNSEFQETPNVGKILRMLILDEYVRQNETYPTSIIQYKSELDEYWALQSKDAKLAFKYKLMDSYFTKLISEKLDKVPKSQFLNEAKIFLNLMGNDDDKKCEEIIKFYCLNYRLKKKKRAGWDNTHWQVQAKRTETVAEHIVSTMALAMAIETECRYDIDLDQVLIMLAIHETGETLIGDITPHDGMSKEQKKMIEEQAMEDALGNLENKTQMLATLLDFDNRETKEAQFAHLIDKLDPVIQCKIYQDLGLQKPITLLQGSKCLKSPKIKDCIASGAKTVFDIWYETEKHYFQGNRTFPELELILKATKDNNLFTNLWHGVFKESIELTEEEHHALVKQIVGIAKKLYDDDNVDCVYLRKEQDSNYPKGNIHVVAVLKEEKEEEPSIQEVSDQISITVQYHPISHYSYADPDTIGMHAEPTILFDKSGRMTKMKDTLTHTSHISIWNQVEYVPPIEKPITLQLKMN